MKNLSRWSQNTPITPDRLYRLEMIFEAKKWPKLTDYGENYFDNFCTMLTGLEYEQQDLVLDLTEHFLWIPINSYMMVFVDTFSEIISRAQAQGYKRICIIPLLSVEAMEKGRITSSHVLWYLIKSSIDWLQKSSKKSKVSISIWDNYSFLQNEDSQEYLICLVDDFIGSGGTALSAIEFLMHTYNCSIHALSLLGLVAQREAINILTSHNVFVCAHEIREKGITDYYADSRIQKGMMETIEKTIGRLFEQYRFGYCKSEALVKMARTPNNTFPIFWLPLKGKRAAPFPRS